MGGHDVYNFLSPTGPADLYGQCMIVLVRPLVIGPLTDSGDLNNQTLCHCMVFFCNIVGISWFECRDLDILTWYIFSLYLCNRLHTVWPMHYFVIVLAMVFRYWKAFKNYYGLKFNGAYEWELYYALYLITVDISISQRFFSFKKIYSLKTHASLIQFIAQRFSSVCNKT